jgi:hypothetical protein
MEEIKNISYSQFICACDIYGLFTCDVQHGVIGDQWSFTILFWEVACSWVNGIDCDKFELMEKLLKNWVLCPWPIPLIVSRSIGLFDMSCPGDHWLPYVE